MYGARALKANAEKTTMYDFVTLLFTFLYFPLFTSHASLRS